MSDPGSTGTENTSSSKKKISPARNVIGLVVLAAVVVAGWFQYSAVFAYNRALRALDARAQDEDKGLMEVPEVESLVGKSPDGPGSEIQDGARTFTKTKYTWRGPLKSYTLTAYYTKGAGPCLHHFEPDGATYVPEPVGPPPSDVIATNPAPPKARGKMGRPSAPGAAPSKTKTTVSGKGSAPGPAAEPSKPATTTAAPSDKTTAPNSAAEPSKAATSAAPDSAPAKAPEPTAEPPKAATSASHGAAP